MLDRNGRYFPTPNIQHPTPNTYMVHDFKKKRNPFRQAMIALGGVLMLVATVSLFIADVKVFKKRQKFESEIIGLQNQIKDTQNKNERLKQDIANVDNEAYIEKIAREELSLQRPGEKVILFVKEGEQKQEEKIESQKSFLQHWLSWIGNIFSR